MLLLGDKYIFDDPLPDYLLILNKAKDKEFLNNFRLVVVKTIKANIKLIENTGDFLYLLPLRYLSSMFNNENELNSLAEQFTINFFSDIKDKTSYDEKIVTRKDAISYLDNSNSSQILLFEGDNPKDKWENRFRDFLDNQKYSSPLIYTEGEIIYRAIYGYVRQAIAIATMDETFHVIPVIKLFLPLHYYTIITSAINKSVPAEYKEYHYNWKISQIVYLLNDIYKDRGLEYSLGDIIKKRNTFKFKDRIDRIDRVHIIV